ncbi:MAG: hypothetical protein ABIH78_00680 [Candidatus Peregrinibacteria bacterium]
MENKLLIDLSIKYGLDTAQVSKLTDMVYQCGVMDLNSQEASRIATFICKMDMINKPAEEIIEELKLKGLAGE